MMKKIIAPIAAFVLMGFGLVSVGLSDADRQLAQDELTKSQELVNATIKDLTPEQLNFKPDENSWSIAECLEHITISEDMIPGMLQNALQTEADPSRRSEVKVSDEDLLGMIRSRDNKVKTSEPFEPSGKYGSVEETLAAFNKKRNAQIDYVKATEDDLRNHYAESPVGTMDGLQVLLFLSGHTERHVAQMKEVMEAEGYPATEE